MAGERDTVRLIAGMDPFLWPDPYGFAVVADLPPGFRPFAAIAEDEGTSLVAAARDLERAGLNPGVPFARITLRVHSDLGAVGLTAAFATALAAAGIPANVIAGFHHDHILVPWDRRHDAMAALRNLADGAAP